MSAARTPIYGLDFCRFFAASSVVFYHLGFREFNDPTSNFGLPMFHPAWSGACNWGWVGVQIFFVISGLVIAYSALGASWLSFARGRVTRLLPAMIICASFMALVAVVWHWVTPDQALKLWAGTLLFLPNGPWITGQIWTLPIEIMFYGFILFLISIKRVEKLELFAYTISILTLLFWTEFYLGFHNFPIRISQLLLLQHGGYFAIGILLAVIDREGSNAVRISVIGLNIAVAVPQIHLVAQWEHASDAAGTATFVWIAATFAIAASLRWKTEIAHIFAQHAKTVRVLGLMTYPLYLIHIHAGIPLELLVLQAGLPIEIAIMAGYGAALAAALLVALWLEPPLNKLISRWLEKLTRRIPA